MPPESAPLYSHPLPDIEAWLTQQGCDRDSENISRWTHSQADWFADLLLDVEGIVVSYTRADGSKVQRSFKYSLSRSDLEKAIFCEP